MVQTLTDYDGLETITESDYHSEIESSFNEEDMSVTSYFRNNPQLLQFLKKKGYYKFNKIVNNKVHKIGFYETHTTPGSCIRSAITGNIYGSSLDDYKVGTYKEDLFFKVCNTTILTEKKVPLILFFDSPEEYEKHFKSVVHDDVKTKWKLKYELAMIRREKEFQPVKNQIIYH